jgi:translation initiation factor IF-2
LSTKKRVYDIAKEYGMTGQDLAKHLRDRGMTQIKGHMAALDDFLVLQIEGMLEAEGRTRVQVRGNEEAAEGAGGLVLKKKKKKPLGEVAGVDGAATAETAEPAVAEPEAAASQTPSAQAPTAQPAQPAAVPEVEPVPAPAKQTPPTPSPIEEVVVAVSEAAPSAPLSPAASDVPHVQESPATATAAAHAASQPETAAQPSTPPTIAAPAPMSASAEVSAPAAAATPVVPVAPAAAPAAAAPAAPAPTAPAQEARKAGGKVLGFIDLSKLKSTPPPQKRPESRRLRTNDDVTLSVQPTLGGDKKKPPVRGAPSTRGSMTAGQLREAQSSRFLRRNATRGAQPAGAPGAGAPTPDRQKRSSSVSPYAGGKVAISAPITVKKLAETLSVKSKEVITIAIQRLGMDLFKVNINSVLDDDTATLLAHEFGVELTISTQLEAEQELVEEIKKKRADVETEHLELRPPTVAFLGHVDHGKTTLIDTIRNSRVADGEAGGITQHVGAYQVVTKLGHHLTIIDTPGHAAFTSMRARGAKAVDIVVLVVAADDGVMPSTEEALAHARAAKVPIVVALTKMDKPEANPQRVMEQLARLELTPEEWGGTVAFLKVAALKKQGVEELLERVFLESEVLELRCHPDGPAQGVVLEAEISEGKGVVAHLLVQDGTLRRGDVILAGEGYGKVRSMHDDRNQVVTEAPPSMPIEVSGLTALPSVGETFYVVEDLATAKEVAEERTRKNRAMTLVERRAVTAESLHKAVADSKRHMINLVVRADVQGSVEVLKSALSELKHDEVEVKVVLAGVGSVTESDVLLASTTGATIIAFHGSVNDKGRVAAEREGVEIRHYEVIYELLDDVRALMEGMLAPEMAEEVTGHVEVRALFKSSKVGNIAGSHVIDGTVFRDSKIRVRRGKEQVFEGSLSSLRREKDDVKEVRAGFDCGLTVRDYQDIAVGDVLEAYRIIKKKRTLGAERE